MERYLLQVGLIVAVFIAAWRFGREPEKYVATTYAGMLLADSAFIILADDWFEPDYGALLVFRFGLDAAAFLAVTGIALRYDRWWVLWVGSAQFIAVMAHLLRAAAMPLPPFAYAVMERWPIWIALMFTALGIWLSRNWEERERTFT